MLSFLLSSAISADHSRYKTCEQSNFCTRDLTTMNTSFWIILPQNSSVKDNTFTTKIYDKKFHQELGLLVQFLEGGIIRTRVYPIHSENFVRYDITKEPTAFNQTALSSFEPITFETLKDHLLVKSSSTTVKIYISPFSILIESSTGSKITLNPDDTAIFETRRNSTENPELFSESKYGGHTDTFKNGPTSVSMTIQFHTSGVRLSGLPAHTLPLTLPTSNNDPIRFFNTDINSYELNSPMAMYGSIPFVIAHGSRLLTSSAAYWANPSETWANVSYSEDNQSATVRFASESGYIDIFIITGPPRHISDSFTLLTGRPQLPSIWSLGFHQCRWGYLTQAELSEVDDKLDTALIPHDVMWLDLDHTDDRKYFTWHPNNFKDPTALLSKLSANQRQLVTLCDPHLKTSSSYYVYKEAADSKFLLLDKDHNEYHANCWPGQSAWVDFSIPAARAWWETLFDYNKYSHSAPNLYTWNDMNEIAVFDSCDQTAVRDIIHRTEQGEVEERDVHNIYGLLMVSATFGGQIKRNVKAGAKILRPFILTRSFFGGAQKYAMVWSGDNTGDWSHLGNSLQIVLSFGISSAVFSGCDVGGFFNSPDNELLARWYITGAWTYPFFRCHCHHLSAYREIYTLPEKLQAVVREAVQYRYKLLPYWYTLAREANLTGQPLVRPMWWDEEKDVSEISDIDDQVMLGDAIAVKPFITDSEDDIDVILPRGKWYDFYTLQKVNGKLKGNTITVGAKFNEGRAAVYLRGGKIVPLRNRIRKSALLMRNDPYNLIVAADDMGEAYGQIYVDDGESFDFEKGAKIHKRIEMNKDGIRALPYDGDDGNENDQKLNKLVIEQIRITGLEDIPKKAMYDGKEIEIEKRNNLFILHRVNLPVHDNWYINFEY